jgi:hypothetical protein
LSRIQGCYNPERTIQTKIGIFQRQVISISIIHLN